MLVLGTLNSKRARKETKSYDGRLAKVQRKKKSMAPPSRPLEGYSSSGPGLATTSVRLGTSVENMAVSIPFVISSTSSSAWSWLPPGTPDDPRQP